MEVSSWENHLFLWAISTAMLNNQRVNTIEPWTTHGFCLVFKGEKKGKGLHTSVLFSHDNPRLLQLYSHYLQKAQHINISKSLIPHHAPSSSV